MCLQGDKHGHRTVHNYFPDNCHPCLSPWRHIVQYTIISQTIATRVYHPGDTSYSTQLFPRQLPPVFITLETHRTVHNYFPDNCHPCLSPWRHIVQNTIISQTIATRVYHPGDTSYSTQLFPRQLPPVFITLETHRTVHNYFPDNCHLCLSPWRHIVQYTIISQTIATRVYHPGDTSTVHNYFPDNCHPCLSPWRHIVQYTIISQTIATRVYHPGDTSYSTQLFPRQLPPVFITLETHRRVHNYFRDNEKLGEEGESLWLQGCS